MLAAIGERDVIAFVGSLFNAAVIALVGFGLVVALIVVGRGLLMRAWAWCQLTPRRRLLGSLGAMLMAVVLVLFWVPVRGLGANESPRSLAGVTFRPLTAMSRGTLADLFGRTPDVESSGIGPTPGDVPDTSGASPGERPVVTTDIGSGPVEGPPPGQSTSAAGTSGSGATAGNTSDAPTAGATPARAAPSKD
jgi:hypothetical protein